MKKTINIVWFKRDLRTEDHKPLAVASANNVVLPIYIIEDEYWQLADTSYRQWQFIKSSLIDLNQKLCELGQSLQVYYGNSVEILSLLAKQYHIAGIYSHQETGNDWTYQRDLVVKKFCIAHNILWHESPQFAVVRGLLNRKHWQDHWLDFMSSTPVAQPQQLIPLTQGSNCNKALEKFRILHDGILSLQPGGSTVGHKILRSFLAGRYVGYHHRISSPNTAFHHCSRLSPHITYGTLSLRTIWQQTQEKISEIIKTNDNKYQLKSLRAFNSRLHWHCHFIQKLESEPEMEHRCLLPSACGLRDESNCDQRLLQAWKTGHTGYPLVDAAMRALIACGWINFRMRAMLVSFASYQLWLHWTQPAKYLASLFTDYEPGIHYAQFQMQSGTTGINTIRIYNPVKQSYDQDPEGKFIKQWLPELSHLDGAELHEPWQNESIHNSSYVRPIVDNIESTRHARDKIYKMRETAKANGELDHIIKKHVVKRRKKQVSQKKVASSPQLSFDFI